MSRFVEGIEIQPAAAGEHGSIPVPRRQLRPSQPLEGGCDVASVGLSLGDLPLVECLAVPETEAVHEWPAIKRERLVEQGVARLTGRGRVVTVFASTAQQSPEGVEVDVDRTGIEDDRRSVDLQAATPERAIEHRERPPERAAGVGAVRFGPEQCRDRVAARRPPGHREVREECDRLARVDGQRHGIDADVHGAEESDRNAGQGHQRYGTASAAPSVT